MSERLATYLNDHLAGARFAVELLEQMRDAHRSEPLGPFAQEMLDEIGKDRAVLQDLAERVGGGDNTLREATAWLAQKTSRLKLGLGDGNELGTFESLETLALGVLGKRALWQALALIADTNPSVRGPDYDHLIARAEAQYEQVEARRMEIAQKALRDE
jgi:hypothetical protein